MLSVLQGVLAGINSVVLLILVFKYLQEIRQQRLSKEQQGLEIQKLRYELEATRDELERTRSGLIAASERDVERYIIRPLASKIDEAASRFTESARMLHDLNRSLEATQRHVGFSGPELQQAQFHTLDTLDRISSQVVQLKDMLERQLKDVLAAIRSSGPGDTSPDTAPAVDGSVAAPQAVRELTETRL